MRTCIFFLHNTHRFWWHKVLQNCHTMANITSPNGTPKDVNDQLGGVKGLNPDDLNDTAFKLVTIRIFCFTKTHLFFRPRHLWLSLACWCNDEWWQGEWQHLDIIGHSLARSCDSGGGGRTTTMVPRHSWPSLACSRMAKMAVAWTDGRGSGGGANNGFPH